MFLIAGLTSYLLFHFYFQQRARYSYPTVEASIDSVYFSSYRPSGKDYTIQSANLAYSYAIMGSRYSGRSTAIDQYGELMTITSGTFDKQAVAELRNKSNVSVYYNPEDPSDSFITPEVNGGLLVGAIIGCLFSLLGLDFCSFLNFTGYLAFDLTDSLTFERQLGFNLSDFITIV